MVYVPCVGYVYVGFVSVLVVEPKFHVYEFEVKLPVDKLFNCKVF